MDNALDSDVFNTPAKGEDTNKPSPTAEQTRLNLLAKQQQQQPSKLAVGNFLSTVPTIEKAHVVVTGALFQKEHSPTAGSDEERHLILAICADLKSIYELLTTS